VRCTKILQKFEFGGHSPTPGSPHPKMCGFAESLQKNQQKDVGVTGMAVATPPHPSVNKQCSCVVRQFYADWKICACCLVSTIVFM